MAKLSLLLAILTAPMVFSQCSIETAAPYFQRSVYEFSADLVHRIAQETDDHFITSALSPWTLLSTLSLGATRDTLAEIKKVLRMHPHKCFNKKIFEIIQKITTATEGVTLERSSTLFVDNRIQLKDVFRSRIASANVSGLHTLPFDNFATVASVINDYVNHATHGTIDDIVSPSDLEGVYLVLIDALYFKGTWATKFSEADTEETAFYNDRREQIGDVNLMFAEMNVHTATILQLEASVLELPYVNDRFAMLILLPDEDVNVRTVIENLKDVSLKSIYKFFEQYGKMNVLVQVPRFKISSELTNLKELLIDMGLKSMFDERQASFEDLAIYSSFISNIIQKANVEVTEEGSRASVASAAFVWSRSLNQDQFVANRPFLFMIVDKEAMVPLFTGAYSKPSKQ